MPAFYYNAPEGYGTASLSRWIFAVLCRPSPYFHSIEGGEMDNKKKRLIRDYCYMIIGSLLISIASKNIYDPAGLIIGGVHSQNYICYHALFLYFVCTSGLHSDSCR